MLKAHPSVGSKVQVQELEWFTLGPGNSMGGSFGKTSLAAVEG